MRSLIVVFCVLMAVCFAACGDTSSGETVEPRFDPILGPADNWGGPSSCDGTLPDSSEISLPADEGPHSRQIEWWYWTGHLETEDGREFGFEIAFFETSMGPLSGTLAHFAVTDVAGQTGPDGPIQGRGYAEAVGPEVLDNRSQSL